MAIQDVMFAPDQIDPVVSGLFGGMLGAVIALGIMVAILFFVALYAYVAFAWMTIGKKLGYKKSWLAWIPIANFAMMLQLGRFNWAWVFLILIPFVGWIALFVLIIIATWRIFERRGYPGWFSLSMIIPQVGFVLYMIAIGFVAWKDKRVKMDTPRTKARPKRRKR